MEGLRIRIPQVFHCVKEGCLEYVFKPDRACVDCRLLSRMRQKVATTALARESKLVHGSPLRSDTGSGC